MKSKEETSLSSMRGNPSSSEETTGSLSRPGRTASALSEKPALSLFSESLMEAVVDSTNMEHAWKQVRANRGAPGPDGITLATFPDRVRPRWPTIRQQLLDGTYRPEPVRRKVIVKPADRLYRSYRLRRVYYSAFSPVPHAGQQLPVAAPPLVREHRLYQADWLLRYYDFSVDEIVGDDLPQLDLELDPKHAWALRNRDRFPIDVNRADRELLLRVPGLGVRNVQRILMLRQQTQCV